MRIPGTGFRVGLDPLLGLVPGFGDLLGATVSGYILVLGARAGVPGSVLVRMVANVAVDSLLGAVPLVGDLFDAGYKSNVRNVALLEGHLERPGATQRHSRAFVALLVLAVLALLVGSLVLAILLLRWLGSAIS